NYGWPVQSYGRYRNPRYRPPALEGPFVEPAYTWAETVAPTGLTFYTGEEFPEWRGDLFVAGLSGGSLWRLQVRGEEVIAGERLFADAPLRLRKVRQGPDGRLYLLTDNAEGRLLRLAPSPKAR
ncbi:MAG: PQQ-dependent sugar dehydrogenase, partial [Pseudomonadota bacterium]